MYVYEKQTYLQIADKIGRSVKHVQRVIDYHLPKYKVHKPQGTFLVADACFFGKEQGLLVIRSPQMKQNLWWTDIEKELISDYELGIFELRMEGFTVKGITVDGKPGVIARLSSINIPVQMCHFHQIQIVLRYITRNPRLPAARELKSLIHLLPQTDKASFVYWLDQWHRKWTDFLNEKTYHKDGRWHYTHKRLRQAYRSIKKHLPHLFTYLDYFPHMPNTTNSLEGSFTHLKDKVRLHRGLKWHRKIKLIFELLQ